MTDDIQSMEVSGYLCTLDSAGLVGIESCRNIYVPTPETCLSHTVYQSFLRSRMFSLALRVQLLFSMPLVGSESTTILDTLFWPRLRIIGPVIGLLVVYPFITQDTFPRYRLRNHCLIFCCLPNRYGSQLLKIYSSSTAFTTMVSPVAALFVIGGLLIILCNYPRCATPVPLNHRVPHY